MHFTGNGQPTNPSPGEIEQQARAHLLESSLTTMEDFLEQEDRHRFLTAYEHVYRATGDTYTTFAEKIAKIQEMVASGEMSEEEMAHHGYEPTRCTTATRQSSGP